MTDPRVLLLLCLCKWTRFLACVECFLIMPWNFSSTVICLFWRAQCKHDFCWVCLEPWKKHSTATGGYFRCNRYEVVKKVEENQDVLKSEVLFTTLKHVKISLAIRKIMYKFKLCWTIFVSYIGTAELVSDLYFVKFLCADRCFS